MKNYLIFAALFLCAVAGVVVGRAGLLRDNVVLQAQVPLENTLPALKTAAPQAESAQAPSYRVNINTASVEQLDELPGIGPAIAQRIVEYRAAHGMFKTTNELKSVSGVGDALFAHIEALVTIG